MDQNLIEFFRSLANQLDWGQYGGLSAAIGNKKIIVTCEFYKNGKKMPEINCPIDIHSFSHTIASAKPVTRIADELQKISKELNHLTSGFKKLQIDINSDSRKEKRQ